MPRSDLPAAVGPTTATTCTRTILSDPCPLASAGGADARVGRSAQRGPHRVARGLGAAVGVDPDVPPRSGGRRDGHRLAVGAGRARPVVDRGGRLGTGLEVEVDVGVAL